MDITNETRIVYPHGAHWQDDHKEETRGYRAPYFYLEGDLEAKAGYDCVNVSAELLSDCLKVNTIGFAVTIFGDERIPSLVFKGVDDDHPNPTWGGGARLTAWIVACDDIDAIKSAIRRYPKCGLREEVTATYLKDSYPESYELIKQSWKKLIGY
jgi:hypothetical protein